MHLLPIDVFAPTAVDLIILRCSKQQLMIWVQRPSHILCLVAQDGGCIIDEFRVVHRQQVF